MKKILLIVLLIFPLVVNAQNERRKISFDIGMGAGYSTLNDHKNSSNIVWSNSISIMGFYFEFNMNLAKGKGEYLNFSSSQTYPSNKTNISSYLAGWNVYIPKSNFVVVPKIGVVEKTEIFEDPVLFNSWYKGNPEYKFTVGASVKYLFKNNLGIVLGASLHQPISVQALIWF